MNHSTANTGTPGCFAGVRLLTRCIHLRNSPITTEANGNMTPNTSKEALGRNSEYLVDLEEERLQNAHLVKCLEASYRPPRTPSKAGGGAHGTQTVQRTEAQQAPSRIEELNRDSLLRFRDEWVRNRVREIQQGGSIHFHTCSDDTASITALNEFYRWRVFDGFKAEPRDEKEAEIEMMQGSHDFGRLPKDMAAAGKLHKCRSVCREEGHRISKRACRSSA